MSIALVVGGEIKPSEAVKYIASQIFGALLAAYAVYVISGKGFAPMPAEAASCTAVLMVEILFTFALIITIYQVAVNPATQGNSYYGMAIGFSILAAAFAGGPISGGAFNPAVGIGPSIINCIVADGTCSNIWYYIVGPVVGAILATFVYKVQSK